MLPVIVKPNQGWASQFIYTCHSIDEVETALKASFKKQITFGISIKEMLIQKQLFGTEYMIDSISWDEEHYIVNIMRYQRFFYENNPVPRSVELIDPTREEIIICCEYIKKVLTSLGIRYGLAHSELFYTPDGPFLIESNLRVSGGAGLINAMTKIGYQTNQVELFSKILLGNKISCDYLKHPPKPYALTLALHHWSSNPVGEIDVNKLKTYSSYKDIFIRRLPGSITSAPKSINDTIANVLLVNLSQEKIKEDVQSILELEERGELFLKK